MTEQQLNETLGKIGKAVFVEFYEAFADINLRNSDIASSIVEFVRDNGEEDPSYKAASTRVA